jgi:hypothetical protein
LIHHLARRFNSQPSFADSTRPHQRQQTASQVFQQPGDSVQLAKTSNEGREFGRQSLLVSWRSVAGHDLIRFS